MESPVSGSRSRSPVLSIRGLEVCFGSSSRPVRVVDGVSLELREGERLALVGESGCGKSLTALAVVRLLPEAARITGGQVIWRGKDVAGFGPEALRRLRGGGIGFVFQDPGASLNPVRRIGSQVAEALRLHNRTGGGAEVADLLRRVRIPDPARVARAWPQELSGGMQQRAMIAIATAARPALLIADEPTTALDVTVQAQIFELLAALQKETGMALFWITHDLAPVPGVADRLAVMYAGRIVEQGPVGPVLARPAHPYTRALLSAAPGGAVPPGTRLPGIPGRVPDPADWPAGCRFHPRCVRAQPVCSMESPGPRRAGSGREVCCHNPEPGGLSGAGFSKAHCFGQPFVAS